MVRTKCVDITEIWSAVKANVAPWSITPVWVATVVVVTNIRSPRSNTIQSLRTCEGGRGV